MVGHINEKYDPCTEAHSVVYFNLPEVQKAIHVDPAHAPSKWSTCRYGSLKIYLRAYNCILLMRLIPWRVF
jgi:hypothetical protein